jgi:hypothetical protein
MTTAILVITIIMALVFTWHDDAPYQKPVKKTTLKDRNEKQGYLIK